MPVHQNFPVHAPLERWFAEQGWTPQEFQREVWQACAAGEDGLLQAPTGSGKTYAAMGHVMADAANGRVFIRGLKLLWVAPLRALSADIADAARRMAAGLGLEWEVGLRTGDTSAKVKAQQKKALPDVLITTPESLHILLAQRGGAQRLAAARMVVVDEWHELLGSKRGVQTELAISWIRQLGEAQDRRACVWGISATLSAPEVALDALVGSSKGVMVRAEVRKEIEVQSAMPKAFARLPWAGHIGLELLDEVVEVVEAHTSTLIFTNTRRQA
ncbi:MAG: DEAD/DEAH box helicase [Flavobacteriales bacterium]|nr:DEAD/DEAH box helicase [Flavobacteriales bacterium]